MSHPQHSAEQPEKDWRALVSGSLIRLEDSFGDLQKEFATVRRENDLQHSELTKLVERYDGRVDILAAKYEAELKRINDVLLGKNKLIRALLITILFLAGIVAEAKLHVSSIFKMLGFGS